MRKNCLIRYFAILFIFSINQSYAAGPINNSGSNYGAASNYSETNTKGKEKEYSQIREGTSPSCYKESNSGIWYQTLANGSYDKSTKINNYFIAPFPGCYGYKWTENMRACITGAIVWRFYGTINSPAKSITLSKAGVENPCNRYNTSGLFYPNPMDSGVKPSELNILKIKNADLEDIYLFSNRDRVTTGPILEKVGECNDDLVTNVEFKNRLEESIKNNKLLDIKNELYNIYQEVRRDKFDILLASLYINHDRNVSISSPEDISLGSTKDCSSIYDYQQYIKTGVNEKYKSIYDVPQNIIDDGTVVVGTCAVATERPARIYQDRYGNKDFAFYGDKAERGMLTERYSKSDVGLEKSKKGTITDSYIDAIIKNNFNNLPKGFLPWPSQDDIRKKGSTAWIGLSEPSRSDIEAFYKNYVKCTYDIIKPVDNLIGGICSDDNSKYPCSEKPKICESTGKPLPCPTKSPEATISGAGNGVYLVVESNLPKYYTASGDLQIYTIPSKGNVLCNGTVCKKAPEICDPGNCPIPDPIIIDYNYKTDLIGVNGYRECTKKNELKCDFFSTIGNKDSAITATFYSPSAKNEYVRIMVNSPIVRYIPQRYVEFCSPIVIGVDPESGEDIMGCETKFRLVQDPERATSNYIHKKGGENKGVTGSSGN